MNARFFVGWKWLVAVGSASFVLMAFDNPDRISAQVTSPSKPTPIVASFPDTSEDTATLIDPVTALEQTAEKPAATALPAALKDLSPGMDEIIKLAQGGVSETVLLSYINNSRQPYKPTVDEILFLTDLGVADTVISALVRGNPSVPVTPTPSPAAATTQMVAETPAPVATNAVPTPEPAVPATQTVPFETQPVNVSYYYSSLAPYGSWFYVGGYGYCWQPTVCNTTPGWRPYSNRGCWVYTDAGWYWKSDYSWGWAAFHYGRWDYHNRHGWVWCPGSTWAPSWVTWRSQAGYAGWAPLPSSVCYNSSLGLTYRGSSFGISVDIGLGSHYYTFVPTSRFCDRQLYNYYVPAHQNHSIYQNSTVINNYVNGNNNTIINEGISRDQIAAATRTDIRRVNIQSMATVSKDQARRELLDQNRNTLVVYRPHPVANPPSTVAGSRPSVATPTFAKQPPGNRRITIPATPDQNRTAENPLQRQPLGGSSSPVSSITTASTQSPTFTKMPAPNRRITTPSVISQNKLADAGTTVQRGVAEPVPVAGTAPTASNPKLPPANRRITIPTVQDPNQPAKNSGPSSVVKPIATPQNPPARPSTYANNSADQISPPAGQLNRSTPPVSAVPNVRPATPSQPSIQTQAPVSAPRTQPQIIQQPRPVAPFAPSTPVQVAPRTPNYTPPVTRPAAPVSPSQPAPAPNRVSPPSAPQSQSQQAAQNGGQNYSQGNQGGNSRSGGSDRSR